LSFIFASVSTSQEQNVRGSRAVEAEQSAAASIEDDALVGLLLLRDQSSSMSFLADDQLTAETLGI